jgi:hypothetical protein
MSPNGKGDNYTRSRSNSWVSSTSLLIASTSTWPRKPRNWTTFQVPWESIEATCLGASIARRTVESGPLGTSWTSSRSSSRARSARASCGQLCYIDGEIRKPSASTLTCCSTEICSLGWTRSGWYTSRRTSLCFRRRRAFSRACVGAGRAPNGMPLDPEVRRLLDHVSRSRSVRTTAGGLVRQAPAGPTQR